MTVMLPPHFSFKILQWNTSVMLCQLRLALEPALPAVPLEAWHDRNAHSSRILRPFIALDTKVRRLRLLGNISLQLSPRLIRYSCRGEEVRTDQPA